MADTNFTPRQTRIVSTWLQDINDYVYRAEIRPTIFPYLVPTNGTSDCAPAINAMLAALAGSTNAQANFKIRFPKGIFKIGSTISPPNSASNFTIEGDGLDSTIFVWTGGAGSPMFQFINARHVYMDDLSLYGNSAARPSIMVNFHRAAGLNPPAGAAVAYCGLRRVRIGDGTADHVVGVKYSAAIGQDSNNEQGTFEDVEIIGSTQYGYHFGHSNSLLHHIVRGNVASYAVAAICNDCAGADNASFDIEGTTFAGLAGSVIFFLGKPRFPINIRNCAHENSGTNDTAIIRTVSAWVGGQVLNFWGGNYAMGDITVPGTFIVDWEAGDALSELNFFAFQSASPTTSPWRVRGNGSVVNFFGGAFNHSSLDYSCEVNVLYSKQGSGAPTYTNLGGGVLNTRFRGKGSNSKDVTPFVTALTGAGTDTLDISGYTGDTVVASLAAPDTLTTITGGVIGRRLTILAANSNLSITHDNSFTADKIFLRGRMDRTLKKLDSITLERMDATASGSEWIEVDSNVSSVQLSGSNVNVTQVGNVGGGTDDLMTFSLPANALDSDSGQGARGVRITAWGTTANNANAKTVTAAFGASTLVTLALTAAQVSSWRIAAEVMWTAEDTQKFVAAITQGGTAKQSETVIGTAAENDDAAITIKCTGAGTADNDIVQHGLIVELIR